jgi:mono/diheme cytochrome c family protein
MGYAAQSKENASSPANKTPFTSGVAMYANYCSPCHGVDGKGHGPIPTERKTPPIDLTVLSKNNHGKFPEAHVIKVLQFGSDVPSHTSVEMPVWGPILGKINRHDPKDRMVRISNLSRYLETIQTK